MGLFEGRPGDGCSGDLGLPVRCKMIMQVLQVTSARGFDGYLEGNTILWVVQVMGFCEVMVTCDA